MYEATVEQPLRYSLKNQYRQQKTTFKDNHLKGMSKLINQVENAHDNQIIIATHSSLICSRLDLRKSILLNSSANVPASLSDLTD